MIESESISNRKQFQTAKLSIACILFGLSVAAHESSAAEISFNTSLISTASSIWETNQNNQTDVSEEPDTVLTFKPELSLSISGRQADIIADFGVLHRVITNTGLTSTTPEVQVNALSRVYGNTYTVGATAQAVGRIENVNSSVDGTVEKSDEIPVIYGFEFRQSAITRMGSKSIFRAQHSSAIAQSTLDSDIGSNSHTLEFKLDSLFTRTGLIGTVRGGYQFTDYEDDIQASQGIVGSQLQVPITAAVSMNAAAGYEWYQSDETDIDLAEEVAYLGLIWNPTERLSAELGYGKRIYEDSPRARISYTARRSGFSLSWTRTLQANRLFGLADDFDATANDVVDAATNGASVDGGVAINEQAVSGDEVLNFNGLNFSSPLLDQQRSVNEIVTLDMFFNTRNTSYSAVFAYVENEEIETSGVGTVSEIARIRAVRTFNQSLDIGLEGAFSSEVDESDTRSNRRKISIFSKWQF